jgi:spermidine/putrescine ABC transporter ATP-binding subunit
MTEAAQKTGKRVSLQGITKLFGDFAAVSDIHFTVQAGEFCTLLGPSGSGKTTILKMIAGFEKPTRGTLSIDDRDVSSVSVSKRNIGMVFQNYALFPHMTVASNIAFPLEMRRQSGIEIKKRVQDVLKLVDLEGLGDRYPRQLSGGQQQRVALARAMVFQPDILLMDEPLGALDKNLRQSLQVELKRLHGRLGVTVIYVTHDQEEAMHLSDRIVVTRAGLVEQIGSPEELYNGPRNVFVASFLGECNLLKGTLESKGPERSHVRLENGKSVWVLHAEDLLREKDTVMVGIRPEHLRVGNEAEGVINRLEGHVDSVIFCGNDYKIYVHDGRQIIVSTQPNRKDLRPVKPGDMIQLFFSPEEAFLLPLG